MQLPLPNVSDESVTCFRKKVKNNETYEVYEQRCLKVDGKVTEIQRTRHQARWSGAGSCQGLSTMTVWPIAPMACLNV